MTAWASSAKALSASRLARMLTRAVVGEKLYPRTDGERAAGVTPVDYAAEPGNIYRYGAAGDGVTDDLPAINQAIAANHRAWMPAGSYLISGTIVVPPGKALSGDGYGTCLVADNIAGPALLLNGGYIGGGSDDPRSVHGFRITGAATIGVHGDDAQVLDLHDIWLNGLTCNDGFVFENVFASSIWNLYTHGADITQACFLCGQAFNANDCSNWYTSNEAEYSLLLDASYNGGNGVAHGSTFTMMCLQSTKYGVFVRIGQAHSLTVYMESIVHPLRLGDYDAGLLARGIMVQGDFGGPYDSHPNYDDREAAINLDYASGCRVAGDYAGAYNCGVPLSFTGGGGAGAFGVARVNVDGTLHSAVVLTPGTGYVTAPTVVVGGIGSGAAITATVDAGAVNGLTIAAPGSGYVPVYCPVLVKYNRSFRNEIGVGMFNSGVGEFSPMYPFVVRDATAPANCGVTIFNDYSLRTSAAAASSAEVRKTSGFGHTHAVIERDETGAAATHLYTPPAYP